MNARIIPLPTAATSYFTVRRAGKRWAVVLVTPCTGGKPVRTTLARADNYAVAVEFATESASSIQRPLKLPKRATP
jgi:hypothetical protein